MTEDNAHVAQRIFDDAAAVAKALGIAACPIAVIPVSAVTLLVDLGFAEFFHLTSGRAREQIAAQSFGVAAAEASAATTALEHARAIGSICRPCLETFDRLVDEEKARP